MLLLFVQVGDVVVSNSSQSLSVHKNPSMMTGSLIHFPDPRLDRKHTQTTTVFIN